MTAIPLRTAPRGFTLVEIMVVVVLIGLLATMALPAFQRARIASQNTRLANDLRQFKGAFETYNLEHGTWPPDVNEGVFPPEMDGYITPESFTQTTAVGGHYDWDGPGAYAAFTVGVSIRGSNMDDARALQLDHALDDGVGTSGLFRISLAQGGVHTLLIEE